MTDSQTLDYYALHVKDVFARYESVRSPLLEYFPVAFFPGSRVLDVGCGSGRDLKALLGLGYNAYGVEPVSEFRHQAVSRSPQLSSRIHAGHLPTIQAHEPYDGVLCSAVLMHVPSGEQLEAFVNLRNLLKVGGRLLLSIPASRDDLDRDYRDPEGRLFLPLDADRVRLIAEQLGLVLLSQSANSDALGRSGVQWHIMLFEKSSDQNRPLDRIEAVLKHDRKVATYKLALLRAFCDMSDRDSSAVSWLPGGYIGMPVSVLAECWLRYYWPLIAAPIRVPQSNNDHANSTRQLAFREPLGRLIELCQENYGSDPVVTYSLFVLGWKKGNLPVSIVTQLNRTLTVISRALLDGPVKHAAQGDMFCYDKHRKLVLLEVDLWREFCLSGYWIRDSLLLRWAELCASFARNTDPDIHLGVVIPLLTQDEDPKREQGLARRLYEEAKDLTCVWSDQKITMKDMEVDHALPFSLWHNNDLWNLLPSFKRVNNAKRDKVPTPEFLRRRHDIIIDTWRFANQIEPKVFQYEIERTLGKFQPKCWELDLFQHLLERSAQAIYQRGEEPWEWS
ncbi:class I SAM-dependent methyltransferase [Oceanobacter mangrovi]|uniref:class I SAM-dependent methyltransferase n=1 Tax=Oceanobacter mangrovi TaxID=2862510 RepID=UPI001C8E3867|nr:class I SAM-dependent methyltransferase [Oceanobacter mangrovi]